MQYRNCILSSIIAIQFVLGSLERTSTRIASFLVRRCSFIFFNFVRRFASNDHRLAPHSAIGIWRDKSFSFGYYFFPNGYCKCLGRCNRHALKVQSALLRTSAMGRGCVKTHSRVTFAGPGPQLCVTLRHIEEKRGYSPFKIAFSPSFPIIFIIRFML